MNSNTNVTCIRVLRTIAARHIGGAFVIGACLWAGGCERGETGDFVKLMNRGKAYLENRNSKEAIATLTQAVKLQPASPEAQRNLARAFRLANQPAEALTALQRAAEAEADSVATEYLTALTLARMSKFEEALTHFSRAVQLDPETAALRFQLAGAYQAIGDHDHARQQLQETVRLDPLHASAHYRLSSDARKAGDIDAFQRHNREFMRLRKLFGDETRQAEALEACVYTTPEPAPIDSRRAIPSAGKMIELRFRDVTDGVFSDVGDRSVVLLAVLEVAESGAPTLLTADAAGGLGLLALGSRGMFERSTVETDIPGFPVVTKCSIGDFHNDVPPGAEYDPKIHAFSDVVCCGPSGMRLLQRDGSTGFLNVTASAGLEGVACDSARWLDYDHDGDLDLVVVGTSGAALWQNNGHGRFQDVTTSVGIDVTDAAKDCLAVDLDANMAVDLILVRGDEPTLVFENQRAGRFKRMAEPPGPWPASRRALAEDLNNDGWPDVVLVSQHQAEVVFGRSTTRSRIDLPDLDDPDAVLVDFDNDGLVDLCFFGKTAGSAGNGSLRLYRNGGDGTWVDVSDTVGLKSIELGEVTAVLAVDFDVDGDSDLLAITATDGIRVLQNDGGHVNGQLKIRLSTIKTNPTGIGTHVELRAGPWWVTRTVTGPVLEIGLAGHKKLDSVQTIWTSGVVDNQIDVIPSSKPMLITEKNVAVGSCPFLYIWDGVTFRFVTDLLGNSPVGLSLRRDVLLPADPDEFVLIGDAEQFPSRNGMYTTVVTDEFREVLYLDQAKLVAVDHRPGVEIHTTDKLMAPPFPPSELWAMSPAASLNKAVGDDGLDRTDAVRRLDGVFARPGSSLPPPYRGMCNPMALTLDFGPLDASRRLVLAMTGWLQYGDASTNIAMSQDTELTIVSPKLEAERSDGSWHLIDANVGMPAGKTKTILCDLTGRLPSGARRLRLTTTFEIRWDRIALLEREALPSDNVHELSPHTAELDWRGFSEIKSRGDGHPTTPEFDAVSQLPAWRTAIAGWCTRYGDVTELTLDRDDRLVLVNSGDALTLEFEAGSLPSVPDGLVRTFFFYSVGWDKDGDYNVVTGDVVGPLPTSGAEVEASPLDERDDWRTRYNTRLVPFDRFTPSR